MNTEFFTAKQVAQLLQISEKTLERMRSEGNGPQYVKIGHNVRYCKDALKIWIDSRIHISTTRSFVTEGGSDAE